MCYNEINRIGFSEDIEYVVRDGDTMFSICSYVAETDEAINLVEGERVYVIGKAAFFYDNRVSLCHGN